MFSQFCNSSRARTDSMTEEQKRRILIQNSHSTGHIIQRMSAPVTTSLQTVPKPILVPQRIAFMSAPVTTGVPRKQLVAQKIARMSAPVTTGVVRKPLVVQKIARMSAPVTTGVPRKQLVAQKIARMSAPVTTGIRRHSSKEEESQSSDEYSEQQEQDTEEIIRKTVLLLQPLHHPQPQMNTDEKIEEQVNRLYNFMRPPLPQITPPSSTEQVVPRKQLVAQKIARMSAPVTTGVKKVQATPRLSTAQLVPRKQLVAQKIARMSAPVTTGIRGDSSEEVQSQKQDEMEYPIARYPQATTIVSSPVRTGLIIGQERQPTVQNVGHISHTVNVSLPQPQQPIHKNIYDTPKIARMFAPITTAISRRSRRQHHQSDSDQQYTCNIRSRSRSKSSQRQNQDINNPQRSREKPLRRSERNKK